MPAPIMVQRDDVDKLPPGGASEPPPWGAPRARARLDWPAVVALCVFALLLLLIGYWLFADTVRSWYRYDGGEGWVRMAIGTGFIFAVLFGLKRLLLVEQPGGFKVPILHVDGRKVIDGALHVQYGYATNAQRNVRALTFSPTYHHQVETNSETRALPPGEEMLPPDPLTAGLAALPRVVDLEHLLDAQPSSFAVPFGQDQTGAHRWLDMRKDMLHAGIFGATGAGKDNLIESWFVALTRQNTPDRVQFAILDGKGHWMRPALASRAHMWIAPAGGIGEEGQAQLQAALKQIQAEAKRRGQLVFGADCDTMERYIVKTGQQVPYLVVLISDVMGNIVGDVDKLLVDLISKARALGIRVVVSMQTPTKQNTQWRSNLSTVLCGQLQNRSQDEPALGIAERDMLFPPSRLPVPKDRPGIFSVRCGAEQWLVQAPLVRREFFAAHVADLPGRPALRTPNDDATLSALLTQPFRVRPSDSSERTSIAVPGNSSDGRTDGRRTGLTQSRMKAYLKALAADGKSREYARAWAESRGLQFENQLWTDVRKELGMR